MDPERIPNGYRSKMVKKSLISTLPVDHIPRPEKGCTKTSRRTENRAHENTVSEKNMCFTTAR